jgi:hypothetical protein
MKNLNEHLCAGGLYRREYTEAPFKNTTFSQQSPTKIDGRVNLILYTS